MVISWYGEGCFKIQSGDFVILVDPFDPDRGLAPPRIRPSVLLYSLHSFPIPFTHDGENTKMIFGAGEYDTDEARITGVQLEKESTPTFIKTIYRIELENIAVGVLGHISGELPPEATEKLAGIDVVFFPAGGAPFITQKDAATLLKTLEPKIAIPSFFKIPKLQRDAGALEEFVASAKLKSAEPQEKISLRYKDISAISRTELRTLHV